MTAQEKIVRNQAEIAEIEGKIAAYTAKNRAVIKKLKEANRLLELEGLQRLMDDNNITTVELAQFIKSKGGAAKE